MKIIIILFMVMSMTTILSAENPIVDSDLSFDEAIKGTKAPADVIAQLCLLDVEYYSTDGKLHKGQLVINKLVRKDVADMFNMMKASKFTIAKVIPIVRYKWSDDASMDDNNTSSFNFRLIAGTNRMSKHAMGLAVDINPFFNPVIHKDGSANPSGAKYNTKREGTFSASHPIVVEFKRRGWRWGGEFSQYADNHHFDFEK